MSNENADGVHVAPNPTVETCAQAIRCPVTGTLLLLMMLSVSARATPTSPIEATATPIAIGMKLRDGNRMRVPSMCFSSFNVNVCDIQHAKLLSELTNSF